MLKHDTIPQDIKERAFELLYWFSRFEFALKECNFLRSTTPGAEAQVSWSKFVETHQGDYELSDAGQALIAASPQVQIVGEGGEPDRFFRVERMKFAGKKPNLDKSTIVYNSNITVTGIPLEAYDYVVSGKPAIEWVMERQCVKTDEGTGITNDANLYAIETIGDPAYPLKLLQRVITVSIETMHVVRSLPALGEL